MMNEKNEKDEEDWVKAAMDDDGIVVELLVRIRRAAAALRFAKNNVQYSKPQFDWCVRQRRSEIKLTSPSPSPPPPPPRSSPTTALSLSCGGATATSFSGGDGCVEYSCQIDREQTDASRSNKVNKLSVRGGTFLSKKPKKMKKKTLAELKEEENLLLRERIHLNKELSALRLDLEEKRAANEILKRQLMESTHFAHANDSTQKNEPDSSMLVNVSRKRKREEKALTLPDLNIPLEDGLIC